MINESIKIKGKLEILDEAGNIIYSKKNLIVNTGLALIANRMIGDTPVALSHCAVGDDNTSVSATQSALVSEIFRKAKTADSAVGGVLTIDTKFESFEANFTWKEIGLFNASSGGDMLDRVAINFIKNNQSVTVRFTITFTT